MLQNLAVYITLDMPKNLSLWSQPGSFWLGAGLVSEFPFFLIALFLSEPAKEAIMDFIMSGPLGVAALLSVVVGSFLLTAWLGHRVGFGL